MGVTFWTASGSAGSAGFVTMPSGPESHVAVTSELSWTFVSVAVFVVRLGTTARSKVRRPSVAAGPEATGTGVIAPPLPGAAPRPAGMFTPSIGRPNTAASSSAFSCRPRRSGVEARYSSLARTSASPTDTGPVPARSWRAKLRYSRSLYSRKSVSPYW